MLPSPTGSHISPRAQASRHLFWWALLLPLLPALTLAQPAKLRLLTRVDQVRNLTPEDAAKGYPVKVRGVITMDAPAPDFVVQDASAGIYVEGSVFPAFPHILGQIIEIEGVTGPGKFAPVIREQRSRVIGHGPLPNAHLFQFAELSDGQQDSQWVQIRGIVRSASIDRSSWRETALALHVASGGGEFNVRVPILREQNVSSWVDREVLVEGVCGSLYNATRQLTGILFYVPRLKFIKLETPAAAVPLSSLLRFSAGEHGHRVRVRGTVEFQQVGNSLFLQGEGGGLRVLSPQNTKVEVGDEVEVIGFPAMGESAPILEDAVFHRLEHHQFPIALTLDLDQPWEHYDGALVTTEAKLLERNPQAEGLRLLLQRDEFIFEATLPADQHTGSLTSVPLNSYVRVTGICLVRSGGLWRIPQAFRMLLRSPQDVVVLRKPSWWNLRHALWLLSLTVGTLLVVLAWTMVLRRRVHEQMEVIRQKLRSSAVLEERNRIARELHDTLEQELAGITLQLDLAVDCFERAPRVAEQALETARNMSRHSMVEARRSVWDLRCHLLENGDLVAAFSKIVEPLTPPGADIAVKIVGEPIRLPGAMEMNLLRIGQEAAGNAIKHGRASAVTIELRFTQEKVRLSVTDNGMGFDAHQPSRTGHFGIQDMRERAESMGSQLYIESALNRGTTICVEVPIHPKEAFDEEHKNHSYSRG